MKCSRCDENRNCSLYDRVAICAECLRLIVKEWAIRRVEFAELSRS